MFKRIKLTMIMVTGCAAISLAACHPKEHSASQKMAQGANQLGQGMKQAGSDAEQTLSDSAITAKIKSKLAATQGLTTFQIHVNTTNGVVTLTGTVKSNEEKELAGNTARETDGVKGVDNKLVIATD